MKAINYTNYGTPDVLHLIEKEQPVPKDNGVLIKVHAVSLNASDNEMVHGKPAYIRMWGLFKPKRNILGSDITGEVIAIGKKVTKFK